MTPSSLRRSGAPVPAAAVKIFLFPMLFVRMITWPTKTSNKNKSTTLSGGSLGSCVDEERSQLRELM